MIVPCSNGSSQEFFEFYLDFPLQLWECSSDIIKKFKFGPLIFSDSSRLCQWVTCWDRRKLEGCHWALSADPRGSAGGAEPARALALLEPREFARKIWLRTVISSWVFSRSENEGINLGIAGRGQSLCWSIEWITEKKTWFQKIGGLNKLAGLHLFEIETDGSWSPKTRFRI